MMQMLVAGGLPPLADGLRLADENNPKGYFEWEPAKSLKQSPEAIAAGEGKVVKIISALLQHLPESHQYRVVFMIRPLEEVVSSQNRMLERLGKDVPRTPTGLWSRRFKNIFGKWTAGFPTSHIYPCCAWCIPQCWRNLRKNRSASRNLLGYQ
jgi:hypothetical protein